MKGDIRIANRVLRPLLWAVGALALFTVAVSWAGWQHQAMQAAGLSARMTCSCRYIQGRELGSCREDLAGISWMTLVRYSDDPERKRVTASVPMMATRSAKLKDGFGCLPER
jgi:hypothetical protein